jgi:hypothetical protein
MRFKEIAVSALCADKSPTGSTLQNPDSVLIRTERGCPHPQHKICEPAIGNFNGLPSVTRCGWDSRTPEKLRITTLQNRD